MEQKSKDYFNRITKESGGQGMMWTMRHDFYKFADKKVAHG